MLGTLDVSIIVGYLLLVMCVGLFVSRKAGDSMDEYFLGGRNLPWYLLGVSGMATFIDMGGTAYQCGWFYLLGAKGFWLCIEGAVALMLSFQMIYAGKWMNRSGAMTNAEWMTQRFGEGKQGEAARIMSAVSTLVICVAMMTFFFKGAVQVLPKFLPFLSDHGNLAGVLFFAMVGIYTVASGFYGVIYTDLLQAFLILFLILFIGTKAFMIGTPEYFAQHAPAGWLDLWPADGNWGLALPEQYQNLAAYVEKAKFLGVLVLFWLLNNILMGAATPFDAWTAQRYYAARNEKESSLVTFEWISLWGLRFLLMGGIGILAISLSDQIDHPEKALSVVIAEYLPIGIKGLLLAALLSAGMSTIDSTVNSSAAYFVKDIYQEFINPRAGTKRLVFVGYAVTFLLMLSGVLVGWFVEDIGAVWGWIIMGLFTGTFPPNILKWFWWRANGMSFAFGTVGGVLAALLTKLPALSGLSIMQSFAMVIAISTAATIVGVFLGKAPDMEHLKRFYIRTRPFGFWGPVRRMCSEELQTHAAHENRRDLLLLVPALLWHLSLFLGLSSIMFKNWHIVGGCAVVVIITGGLLYTFWYRNLSVTNRFTPHEEKRT